MEERLRAKKQPLGDLLSTLSSWGGGCSPIPPQIQGVAQVPFPTTCTDLWASNHCQMCPCCWIFPASLCPLFLPSFFKHIPPPRLALPAPTQLQELLLGVGDGMFLVSSQRGSPGNPGNGEKELASFAHTSVLCILSQNGQNHEVLPSLTPGRPPTLAVVY